MLVLLNLNEEELLWAIEKDINVCAGCSLNTIEKILVRDYCLKNIYKSTEPVELREFIQYQVSNLSFVTPGNEYFKKLSELNTGDIADIGYPVEILNNSYCDNILIRYLD